VSEFRPFGPLHLAAVAGVTLFIALLVTSGRRVRDTPRERAFGRVVATAILAFWLGYVAFDVAGGRFDARRSLPLELCDFVAVIAAWVFVTRRRLLYALAYFWGLALSTQALLTPDLVGGPYTLGFWAFWMYHAFVVGAGVYVVAVRGFRPTWRDLVAAGALGIVYAAALFAIDAAFDVNYSYLGRSTPDRPTLLDVLGPWPMRVAVIVALALVAMTLLWIPWAVARRAGRLAPR
jgi:hypothetical integral membrane protein (TIGR02206 family)